MIQSQKGALLSEGVQCRREPHAGCVCKGAGQGGWQRRGAVCDSQLLLLGTRVAWEHLLFFTPLTPAGGRGGTAGQTPHQPKGAASVHHQNLKLLSSSPRKQANYWGPPIDSWPAPQIAVGYSFFSLELLPMDHTKVFTELEREKRRQ